MTTPHGKALTAATKAWTDDRGIDATVDHRRDHWRESISIAISAYLSSIGGIVCARDPVEHQRLVPGFGWQRVNDEDLPYYIAKGFPRRTLHTPIEAVNGGDGWLDIASAPKDGTEIIGRCGPEFPGFSCFYDGARFLHYCNEDGMIAYPITQWRPFPGPSTPSNEGREKA